MGKNGEEQHVFLIRMLFDELYQYLYRSGELAGSLTGSQDAWKDGFLDNAMLLHGGGIGQFLIVRRALVVSGVKHRFLPRGMGNQRPFDLLEEILAYIRLVVGSGVDVGEQAAQGGVLVFSV